MPYGYASGTQRIKEQGDKFGAFFSALSKAFAGIYHNILIIGNLVTV